MKIRYSSRSRILMLALVAGLMAAVAVGGLQASNMGFKMNKVISRDTDGAGNIGYNLIALPLRNPLKNLDDVCDLWGLNAITGSIVEQIDALGGNVNTFNCNTDNPASAKCLLGCTGLGGADCTCASGSGRVGLLVTYTGGGASISGIIVGSHVTGPPGIDIYQDPDAGGNLGKNRYPNPYHTTAVTANDLCVQATLTSCDPTVTPGCRQARVERFDAASGTPVGFNCGDAVGAAFALVLGEAVEVTNQATTIPGFQPPHF